MADEYQPRFCVFDLNINKFLQTQRQMVCLATRIDALIQGDGLSENLVDDIRDRVGNDFSEMAASCTVIEADLASLAAGRISHRLLETDEVVTVKDVRDAIADVESRMTDECELITVLVLSRQQKNMFHSAADEIAGWPITNEFPDAARELEEAARCYALERSTAAVYHGMRMLEIGLLAFAKHLGLPEPEKPAQRNWSIMLQSIKGHIDENYPSKQRMPGNLGAVYEDIYTSLDTVKNPWRNATMHIDAFYQDAEARHIINNVIVFLTKIYQLQQEPELPLKPSQT